MKGSVKRRGNRWRGRADIGLDPLTGKRKVVSVSGRTKGEVQTEIASITAAVNKDEYVVPKKTRFGDWLDTWYKTAKENHRPRTAERYLGIIKNHLKPNLGNITLQKLQAVRIERYYQESELSASGLQLHHAVIHKSLASAVKKRILNRNEAALADKPKGREKSETTEIRENCWDADEARRFLKAAQTEGQQPHTFYSLLLEIGLRKSEAAGLLWEHVDLESGTLQVLHQLKRPGPSPELVLLKSGTPRTIELSAGLVGLLRVHRVHQSELKMRNRGVYRDHGLVFAKEWPDLSNGRTRLGDPLAVNNIGVREFARLLKAAKVRRIKFHGLRHTAATLALAAGVPVKTVAHRLGHSKTSITLDLYSHVLPAMDKAAAELVSSLLHG